MPSKKSNKSKMSSTFVAKPIPPAEYRSASTPVATAAAESASKKNADPPAVAATLTNTEKEQEAHFDVAQNLYGVAKSVWSWGRTVPLLTNLLGVTEAVAAKVVDATVHMDLLTIDEKAVAPQLKKLDNDIVNPVILAVWKIIEPAVAKGEEMVVKPVLTEVIPRVLAPFGMCDSKETEHEKKKQKEQMIDASPTPEVVLALN